MLWGIILQFSLCQRLGEVESRVDLTGYVLRRAGIFFFLNRTGFICRALLGDIRQGGGGAEENRIYVDIATIFSGRPCISGRFNVAGMEMAVWGDIAPAARALCLVLGAL